MDFSCRNLRKSYCLHAVGKAQLKYDKDLKQTSIFCQISPETSVNGTPYTAELVCDESRILFARCYGCPAQEGFFINCAPFIFLKLFLTGVCKHVMAMVGWVHHSSVADSVTETLCYWRKAPLANFDVTLHPSKMNAREIAEVLPVLYKSDGSFMNKVKNCLQVCNAPILRNQLCSTVHPLCMHGLMYDFCRTASIADKNFTAFAQFVEVRLRSADKSLMQKTKEETRSQSASALWRILRYGRVTASILAEVAGCEKESAIERLVNKIFGAEKLKTTAAMARGLRIENDVRKQFCKTHRRQVQPGHFEMHPLYSIFGASPDGVGSDFILEIKSPVKNENAKNFLTADGKKPNRKVLLQILLQMKLCGKKTAYLLITDANFEENKKFKCIKINFDESSQELGQVALREKFYEAVRRAEEFYKKHVFYRMISKFRPILV